MSLLRAQPSINVLELRQILGGHFDYVTDATLERLLRTTLEDIDLAACAMCMDPRPAWLVEIAGPLN
jgi:hypothetical protein